VRSSLRWVAVITVAVVAFAAAFSFPGNAVPEPPPPVRLDGSLVVDLPATDGLVVVPFPSVELSDQGGVTTTTTQPKDQAPVEDDGVDSVDSPDDAEDSDLGSVEASADSADDD
jgi:hypothetical protein